MNLSEALDAALPEIPRSRAERERPPRVDPNLITREETIDGEPVIGVLQRERANFFRFPLAQWQLVQLFDGTRSYDEIAELYEQQVGYAMSAAQIREFAEGMEEHDFWFKTPQEKNLAMSEKLQSQRSRRANRKSRVNLAHISFSAWDPDRYLTNLDRIVGRFIYNPWSVLAVVLLFTFEASVFISRWPTIGPDIGVYYSFANKTFADFVEFWILLFVLGFIHETAHGLTCKHFGGEVHTMGLMFLYLTPAFFVDVTETWISATKVQRLWTIIAGIWIEMVVCGAAMLVWTNTAAGYWLHDLMYKVILITGVAVVVMNLNPLLKLDGYYFLTEFLGIPDLKERSTAFVTEWLQNRVLRMPVEVSPIPRRRMPFYVLYALISGAYSYLVLFTVIRFSYNVTSKLLAEFALIPAGAFAFAIFRSRLVSLRAAVVRLWNEKVGHGMHIRPSGYAYIAIALIILFVPFWRDREDALYVVEPMHPAAVRAAIDGRVDAVLVHEGQAVHAGDPLLHMSSLDASAMKSSADEQANAARFQTVQAELAGRSVGTAAADQQAAARAGTLAHLAQSSLVVTAPADGVVLTTDPSALSQQSVASGQLLLTLAGSGPRIARVYIPYSALKRITPGAEIALASPVATDILRFHLGPLDGDPVPLPPDLEGRKLYKGVELPTFYQTRLVLPPSNADFPLGISGNAKIFGARRSLFSRFLTVASDVIRAHAW